MRRGEERGGGRGGRTAEGHVGRVLLAHERTRWLMALVLTPRLVRRLPVHEIDVAHGAHHAVLLRSQYSHSLLLVFAVTVHSVLNPYVRVQL